MVWVLQARENEEREKSIHTFIVKFKLISFFLISFTSSSIKVLMSHYFSSIFLRQNPNLFNSNIKSQGLFSLFCFIGYLTIRQ